MEFNHKGFDYKVGRINALAQFHIVRRLAPVLGSLAAATVGKTEEDGAKAIEGLGKALAAIEDGDAEKVIFGLLAPVQRKIEGGLGWAPVSNGQMLMYQDIELPDLLVLAWRALSHNLSGFFAALPSDLKEAFQKASAKLPG